MASETKNGKNNTNGSSSGKPLWLWAAAFAAAAGIAVGITALLINIHGKQEEARQYPLMLTKLTDDDVNPETWGKSFPSQYDSFKKMIETDKFTNFGGSLPYSKLMRYPALTMLWAGYPFSADYNAKRSHYYAQIDQMETKRNDKAWLNANGFPKFQGQPTACMNCHSGYTPKLVREIGWENFNKAPYAETSAKLVKEYGDSPHGGALGSTCADCHAPSDMSLRVTRPAYINAMVQRGYQPDAEKGIKADRREMRSHVCQQCHVEYYFKKGSFELTFPWAKWPKEQPLRIEEIEQFYDDLRKDEAGFKFDWVHKITGAPMLKMQHPETELYSSGVHARANVSCADCHMPYQREGANKVTNHKIESPLANINSSCQVCHPRPEGELKARVEFAQSTTAAALRQAEGALLALIDDFGRGIDLLKAAPDFKKAETPEAQEAYLDAILHQAREFHRRASMRWDFVFSENSNGFHSVGESNRVLGQAIEFARRGQLELQRALQTKGIALTPTVNQGPLPPRGKPIEGHTGLVGSTPPIELTKLDAEIEAKLVAR